MRIHQGARCAGAAVLVWAGSCGSPVEPSQLVGDWSAGHLPAHFQVTHIRLEAHGSKLAGTACEEDRSSGFVRLLWSDVPVLVVGDQVTFTVESQHVKLGLNPGAFAGRFNGTAILGTWQDNGSKIRFERGGDLCAGAR